MEWKKNVDTNLGITIILVFAALFTIVDFYVIGSELDGYPFNDLSDSVVYNDESNNTNTVVEDNKIYDSELLSEEEALKIGNELYKKAGEIFIRRGGSIEMENVSDDIRGSVGYKKNDDNSFSRVDDNSFFYNNKDYYRYVKLVISDVTDILSSKLFIDFCNDFEIIKYNNEYFRIEGDRGSNMLYGGTELNVISISNDKIVYDAVSSYYLNADDVFNHVSISEAQIEKKNNKFELILENGSWKVNEFTMPY